MTNPLRELKKRHKKEMNEFHLGEYKRSKTEFYIVLCIALATAWILFPLTIYWVGVSYGAFAIIKYIVVPFMCIKLLVGISRTYDMLSFIKENK